MKIQQKLSNKINHVDCSSIIKWVMNIKNIVIKMPVGFPSRNVVVSKDWIKSVIRMIDAISNKMRNWVVENCPKVEEIQSFL